MFVNCELQLDIGSPMHASWPGCGFLKTIYKVYYISNIIVNFNPQNYQHLVEYHIIYIYTRKSYVRYMIYPPAQALFGEVVGPQIVLHTGASDNNVDTSLILIQVMFWHFNASPGHTLPSQLVLSLISYLINSDQLLRKCLDI